MKEVIGENLGKDLIIVFIVENILFMGTAVVDVIKRSGIKLSQIINTRH